MELDAALLSTQHYKVRLKGKVEKSREWMSALSYTSVLYLLKKEPLGYFRVRSMTLLQTNYIFATRTIEEFGRDNHIRC